MSTHPRECTKTAEKFHRLPKPRSPGMGVPAYKALKKIVTPKNTGAMSFKPDNASSKDTPGLLNERIPHPPCLGPFVKRLPLPQLTWSPVIFPRVHMSRSNLCCRRAQQVRECGPVTSPELLVALQPLYLESTRTPGKPSHLLLTCEAKDLDPLGNAVRAGTRVTERDEEIPFLGTVTYSFSHILRVLLPSHQGSEARCMSPGSLSS